MFELIASQMSDPVAEFLGVQNLNQGLNTLFKKGGLVENHIKPFLGNRDEAETQEPRDSHGGNAHICFFGENRKPNLKVGIHLPVVA